MAHLKYAILQGKVVYCLKLKENFNGKYKMYSKQNVFEAGVTLPGRSEVSVAAATPC